VPCATSTLTPEAARSTAYGPAWPITRPLEALYDSAVWLIADAAQLTWPSGPDSATFGVAK
jgi:hypothetical protein